MYYKVFFTVDGYQKIKICKSKEHLDYFINEGIVDDYPLEDKEILKIEEIKEN